MNNEEFTDALKTIESVLKDYCKKSVRRSNCTEDDCEGCEVYKTIQRIKKEQEPKHEVVEVIINGEPLPCLKIDERVNNADLPEDLIAFQLRDDGYGNYEDAVLEKEVKVNFAFSLVFCNYLGIEDCLPYEFDEETSPNFTGYELSYSEFLERFL